MRVDSPAVLEGLTRSPHPRLMLPCYHGGSMKTITDRLVAVGLDEQWLAQESSPAMAAAIISGESRLPAALERRLYQFEAWRMGTLEGARAQTGRMGRSKRASTAIALVVYASDQELWAANPGLSEMRLPARAHESAVRAVRAALVGLGVGEVNLVRFDPEAYASWLGTRPANSITRSEWAARQPGSAALDD